VQDALPALLEHYHRGDLTLPLIVEKTSHAVARLFNLRNRGYIREGYWADLVLVNLDQPRTVKKEFVLARCGWSPFEGYRFQSTVDMTIVNGQVVYHNGQVADPPRGLPLEFNR
jgi:dihydroorotase